MDNIIHDNWICALEPGVTNDLVNWDKTKLWK